MTDYVQPVWTIWPDQRITRRKLFHIVTSPEGEIVYRSRLLHECVDALAARGVTHYQMLWSGTPSLTVTCATDPMQKD